ncbi:cupin domain-containing protein [Roseibium sp. Sym1]|uniref:cupin domain-containing protein n=1 Tax=Roseibium sp. Sym1 TaxID=3016006 RepID=UPI0022B591E7|nr:cupin domain-containing protein [Roseibium sp. Sym1]
MSGCFHKRAYKIPVSADSVKADFPDFSFGTFRDPQGQIWRDFVHDTDEFVVVADGTMEIEVAGETARCEPGDLVRIPANASHTLITKSAGGSVWHYGYGHFGGDND